jgi:germination protein M
VEEGETMTVYEVNKDETMVTGREITTTETDPQKLVALLLDELARTPENTENRAAIPDSVSLHKYEYKDENITLDFSDGYSALSQTGEVLSRAAIVRTLTQVEDVSYVTFLVDGSPLLNRSGNIIGTMTADQFIDNSGNEINTEEIASLTLYFANEQGDALVKVNREVAYSSNISLEKLVMEQLIKGVQDDEQAYPTLNQQTKVVSATVRDGICYVNLSEQFLTPESNVSSEVVVYSVVNSLVELSNINKVQILVNGEDDLTYNETLSLSSPFERNLELVKEQ